VGGAGGGQARVGAKARREERERAKALLYVCVSAREEPERKS
jgi:hypothetical protein